MEIEVKTVEILYEPSDLAMLATLEDAPLPAKVAGLLEPNDYRGRAQQTLLLYPRGAVAPRRLLLVGLGQRESLSAESIRQAAASAVQEARKLQVATVTVGVHGDLPLDSAAAGQALAEGLELGAYRYWRYRTSLTTEQTFEVQRAVVFVQNSDEQRARAGVTSDHNDGRSRNPSRAR